MCFPYIINRNIVAKTWTRSVDFILLFSVFICLASVAGFFFFFLVIYICKTVQLFIYLKVHS